MTPSPETEPTAVAGSGRSLVPQFAVLAVSAVVAVGILVTAPQRPVPASMSDSVHSTDAAQFDMMAFLDRKVATQEDKKDVRCWSSFNKLQMFLTEAEIQPQACGVRITEQMKLIQSIWEDCRNRNGDAGPISADVTEELLRQRFPNVTSEDGATFQTQDYLQIVNIHKDAIRDYSDTIEPWRLLQTWAMRHTDEFGHFAQSPPFSEDALHVMYDFLRVYDLAVLKQARNQAEVRKLSTIDGDAMSRAFQAMNGRMRD